MYTYDKKSDPNTGAVNKQWIKLNVPIDTTQQYFRIQFFVSTSNASTYLAIDDIDFKAGTCDEKTLTTVKPTLPPNIGKDLGCDFENVNNCVWKPIIGSRYNTFNVRQGIDAQDPGSMLPLVDKTYGNKYGKYAYLYNSIYNLYGYNAVMNATDNAVANYQGKVCFSLWYYMRTTKSANFNITVLDDKKNSLKKISRQGDSDEKWNKLEFEVYENGNGYQYSIKAYILNGKLRIKFELFLFLIFNRLIMKKYTYKQLKDVE